VPHWEAIEPGRVAVNADEMEGEFRLWTCRSAVPAFYLVMPPGAVGGFDGQEHWVGVQCDSVPYLSSSLSELPAQCVDFWGKGRGSTSRRWHGTQ
jgi:hypothetical protein